MKKLALAVTVLAFGAFMVAGCPEANNATKDSNKAKDNAAKCGGDNATDANAE